MDEYQSWYSEALACVRQLIPDRVDDFVSYYRPASNRKEITASNYTMTDYLRRISVSWGGGDLIVGPDSAISPMYQQHKIIEGLTKRFDSTLFDIKTIVQADLFDDELKAADELNKKGFCRGAGAGAGVVLESHLAAVCGRHNLASRRKAPSIADLNELLKGAEVIEVPTWRFIQHLGDIRNLCDHKKPKEPSRTEVQDLIDGVRKVSKTVF